MKSYETFFNNNDYKEEEKGSLEHCNDQYVGALKLLGDYYKSQIYWLGGSDPYSFMAKASRFFSGAWNRQNMDAVSKVIEKHDDDGLHEGLHSATKDANVVSLLIDLRKALLDAGKPVNPKGELVKRINYIQTICFEKPSFEDWFINKPKRFIIQNPIIDIKKINEEICNAKIAKKQNLIIMKR